MIDQDKSKQELIEELADLRQRVAALEGIDAERKTAEEALRASETKYRRLHQSMRDAFVSVDMDGYFREYNEAFLEMFGYEPEELQKLRYMDVTPEKWNSYVAEIVQKQIVLRGYSDVYEKEYRRKDGTLVPIEMRVSLITDNDNQPCGMWAIVRDITERKQAEAALQKAHDELEQRVQERTAELATANENLNIFRKYVEASGVGFGMADMDGTIAFANPILCRLMGEEKLEDVIGKSIIAYYPQEYLQRRRDEMIPALLRDEFWHTETTILRRHGEPIPVQQSTFLILDAGGNPFRTGVVISDITERKRADEALRQSRDQLQAIYDRMFDGLLLADIETKRFLRANAAMARMLGYSEAELLTLSVMDIHPRKDLPFVIEQFQALAEGRIQVSEDIPVLRKDGSVFFARVTSSTVTCDDRPCVVGFFRDVTERKQAHESLQRHYQTLKHLLQSSDNERQLIAYEIHDGLAQQLAGAIMQFQTFDHLKDSQPNQAAKAYDAGFTMLRQGHLETRRLIAGVRPPILDEAGVVEAIAHLVNELRREKGPKIEFLNSVEFDRLDATLENAIYRIAQEALTNACKHSKSEKVWVSLLQRGDRLRIEIRDLGLGFDPKAIPKNHFGLEGIRQRARLLGGRCSIRSTAGKGARISVELPVVPRDEEQ